MSRTEESFASSEAVFAWINCSINHERNLKAATFRLDRMQRLSAVAGNPWKDMRIIHIAGSKGKGSVCTMLAAIFAAYGFKTAKYTSPHILDVRERVSLAEGFFPEDVYIEAGNALRNTVNRAGLLPGEEGPTYFELMTLYFFLCAREYQCEVLVIETGIGGRLDATNIVIPDLSIITPVELEHCDLLGHTIGEIAGEKAGIIKRGKPLLVSSGHHEDALHVFEQRCIEMQSPLLLVDSSISIRSIKSEASGCTMEFHLAASGTDLVLKSPMPSQIQANNAACAVAASLYLLGESTKTIQAIHHGIGRARLPARFQIVSDHPFPIVVDGSHTPKSISMVVQTWRKLYGRPGVLVFGCADDKAPDLMADELLPLFERVIVTRLPLGKSSDIAKIADAFSSRGASVHVIDSCAEAIESAKNIVNNGMNTDSGETSFAGILISGSFYLASSAIQVLNEHT